MEIKEQWSKLEFQSWQTSAMEINFEKNKMLLQMTFVVNCQGLGRRSNNL
jgi:hypothetical protein